MGSRIDIGTRGRNSTTIGGSAGTPKYVGARAEVTRIPNVGVKIRLTDYKGTTEEVVAEAIQSIVTNDNGSLTFTLPDGRTFTTDSLTGPMGPIGPEGPEGERGDTGEAGPTGATGNGIADAELNGDYTLTLNFTDGTSYTTPSIRGATGAQGVQGPQGERGLQGEKGDPGEAFSIVKTYSSIAEMDADYSGTDVKIGEYVMIASTVEDPDNAKVYIKGSQAYQFVVDMSGATGVKGDKGDKGETGPQGPQGPQGIQGIQGIQGEKGDTGATGSQGEKGDPGTTDYEDLENKPFIPSLTSDLENDSRFIKAVDTASGAIATFKDAFIKKLTADINPIQDLHGYTKPWAGGNGKNKLNYDVWKTVDTTRCTAVWENNGVTLTATDTDGFTNQSSFPQDARVPVAEGETITLSWEANNNNDGYVHIFPNGSTAGYASKNNRLGKSVSYTATSGITFATYRFGVQNSGDTIKYSDIQIEVGSTPTDFEPYSNICPISGWTECDVYDDSAYGGTIDWNQLYKGITPRTITDHNIQYIVNSDGTVSASGTSNAVSVFTISENIELTSDHVLYFCGCPNGGASSTYRLDIRQNGSVVVEEYGNGKIVKIANTHSGNVVLRIGNGVSTNGFVFKPQVIDLTQCFGTTTADEIYAMEQAQSGSGVAYVKSLFPKDYYAYNEGEETCVGAVNGDEYRHAVIDLSGTRYGGTIDVTSGVMSVTMAEVDLGTLNWTREPGSNTMWSSDISGKSGNLGDPLNLLCSQYATSPTYITGTSLSDKMITLRASGTQFVAKDDSYTSGASFKTAMEGVQAVYELATPITVQLTSTQIEALLGTNNVWASTGNVELELVGVPEMADKIPFAPTTDGTYTLKVTVTDGEAAYSWVAYE